MKKSITFLALLSLGSCIRPTGDDSKNTSVYEPLLLSRDVADQLIKIDEPRPIENAGKFYIYKDYVFVVEQGKGVHIFDNKNVNNPKNIAFLHLLNITDVAVKDAVLYANQSTDLVAVNISDVQSARLVSRIKDVSHDVSPDGLPLKQKYTQNRPHNTIVVRYEKITTKN